MKNADLILKAGLLATCLPIIGCNSNKKTEKEAEERPNILFILSDDHTGQAWGIYGGILADYVKNENIRRLAQEGCVLDNCFCTNSISAPSRAAIMTGAYSHRNGVYTLEDGLDPAVDNIAKQMQAGGYQTALIGKWHLKRQPAGFDHFNVFHDQGEYVNPIFKTAENWVDDDKGKQGVEVKGFSTDIVTDQTMEWIRNRDKNKPFMMCCHFKATHEPWDFPERMKHLYDDVVFPEPESMMEFGPEESGRAFQGQQLENMGWRWETASKDPDAWWCRYPELPFSTKGMDKVAARKKIYQKMIKDYLRCGATIDDNIGRLLKMLDEEGLSKNTIVVYVSDQGYFLGEHGMFDKRMMYEEPLHMPFVIRYPRGKGEMADWRNEMHVLPIGKGKKLRDGDDIAILSLGPIGNEVIKAIKEIEGDGISIAHYDMIYLKPMDEELLHEVGKKFSRIITVENGVIRGGLGSAVLEFMADNGYTPKIKRIGVPDEFVEHGPISELYKLCGMDAKCIAEEIKKMVIGG